jgi:hypothetical protein
MPVMNPVDSWSKRRQVRLHKTFSSSFKVERNKTLEEEIR